MKTICNEFGHSIYIFPDFVPVEFDEEIEKWKIGSKVIEEIPTEYLLYEDMEELNGPKNDWLYGRYSVEDGKWVETYWESTDRTVYNTSLVEIKINKLLKIMYERNVLTEDEMNSIYENKGSW